MQRLGWILKLTKSISAESHLNCSLRPQNAQRISEPFAQVKRSQEVTRRRTIGIELCFSIKLSLDSVAKAEIILAEMAVAVKRSIPTAEGSEMRISSIDMMQEVS